MALPLEQTSSPVPTSALGAVDDRDADGYPLLDPPKIAQWTVDFTHPVEKVWPLLTNTDRMNRAIGVPPVRYVDSPCDVGGCEREGTFTVAGFKLVWREQPYEWLAHRFMRSERDYRSGPLRRLYIHWHLTPTPQGCRLHQRVHYETRSWIFNPIARREIDSKTRKQFLRGYEHLQRFLDRQATTAFQPQASDGIITDQATLRRVTDQLRGAGVTAELADRLASFALGAPPLDVSRIRPFALAAVLELPRREVLTALLQGARGGVFDVSWDLLCPSCRGDKAKAGGLAELSDKAHCDSCNITFNADLDQSVELTFAVNPAVRQVNVGRYCVGGPQNTPHVLAQLRVPAKGRRTETLSLAPGKYALRSLQAADRISLEVLEPNAEGPIHTGPVVLGLRTPRAPEQHQAPQELRVRAGACPLVWQNNLDWECTVLVEHAAWIRDACLGSYVMAQQSFRDLFSTDVLRAGQELAVRSVSLMFTDLKGSTAMYNQVGDAEAFARVRDHFDILTACVAELEGCIVKTIGDAIMAAFPRADSAVNAALRIQERFRSHNAQNPQRALILKIGIHTGACFAVTLNDRLDYFGSAVNVAARVQGESSGDDIVLSARTYQEAGVAEAVQASGYPVEQLSRELRGFDQAFELYRLDCARR